MQSTTTRLALGAGTKLRTSQYYAVYGVRRSTPQKPRFISCRFQLSSAIHSIISSNVSSLYMVRIVFGHKLGVLYIRDYLSMTSFPHQYLLLLLLLHLRLYSYCTSETETSTNVLYQLSLVPYSSRKHPSICSPQVLASSLFSLRCFHEHLPSQLLSIQRPMQNF